MGGSVKRSLAMVFLGCGATIAKACGLTLPPGPTATCLSHTQAREALLGPVHSPYLSPAAKVALAAGR